MKPATFAASEAVVPASLAELRALAALFGLTLRQHLRGRRLLVLSALYALPAALVVVVGLASSSSPPSESLEFAFALNLIPHTLVPLASLLYAAGIIQDEVEDQTLTYLLLRPMPRWALYLVKLVATLLTTGLLAAVFTVVTFVTIALVSGEPAAGLAGRAVKAAALLALAQVGYCGLFGLLGLFTRRSLLLGVFYIALFEGLLASLDTVARRLTVMYYFRVLVMRTVGPASGKEWSIDLATAPTSQSCCLTLLAAGLVLAVAGSLFFAGREFRVKTPEGT